jgi:glycolate oxidase FAD binding subunit
MVDSPPCTIDDFGPLPVRRPESVGELQDLVRDASAHGQAIYPVGGGTTLHLGYPPSRSGVAADLRGLNQIVDYPADDMTITVRPGITIRELQETLAGNRQRVPMDIPQPGQASLGGAIASNAGGPRRYGFGTWRDYVIGMSVVNDAGAETKAGGRVVKNVAGYDLCKLHVGALGTLGVISQVTLKVRPLPEEQAFVILPRDESTLSPTLDRLHQSKTRPVCLEVLNAAAAARLRQHVRDLADSEWLVLLGFEDNRDAVCWQLQQLVRELTPSSLQGLDIRAGETSKPLWTQLAEGTVGRQDVLSLKCNMLSSNVADFCRRTGGITGAPAVHAHAGNGIVYVGLKSDVTCERAAFLTGQLTAWVGLPGNVMVRQCPPAWKRMLPIWGTVRGDRWLMQRVKAALDPGDVFNPGRFMVSTGPCTR